MFTNLSAFIRSYFRGSDGDEKKIARSVLRSPRVVNCRACVVEASIESVSERHEEVLGICSHAPFAAERECLLWVELGGRVRDKIRARVRSDAEDSW
jgi:hypothetical protein